MKNPNFYDHSKHIDIKLNFIRDIIERGVINVVKIDSTFNQADAMTKTLSILKSKF